MKLILRMGLSLLAVIAAALLFLRITGFEPWYVDPASAEFAESNRTAWPGLWLKGEVVDGPVTDWDFINEVNHPITGNSIMLGGLCRPTPRFKRRHRNPSTIIVGYKKPSQTNDVCQRTFLEQWKRSDV